MLKFSPRTFKISRVIFKVASKKSLTWPKAQESETLNIFSIFIISQVLGHVDESWEASFNIPVFWAISLNMPSISLVLSPFPSHSRYWGWNYHRWWDAGIRLALWPNPKVRYIERMWKREGGIERGIYREIERERERERQRDRETDRERQI